VAALMMNWGMVNEGVECVENIRARFDGEKRNPWDEPECGHHYARAMSSWSTFVAMSGFLYDGPAAAVVAAPKMPRDSFECFWSTGTGWGTFSLRKQAGHTVFAIKVLAGTLACRSCEFAAKGASAVVYVGSGVIGTGGVALKNQVDRKEDRVVVTLGEGWRLTAMDELRITVGA
jgi:hypothetical protein